MQRIKLFASIVAVLTTTSTAVSAAPVLTLSRVVGPPKTTVTATVSGFAAGRTVDVYFDTTAKCLVITSTLGGGSCTLRVPIDTQPETHWISAVLRYTGTGAQRSFIVRTDWAQFHGNASHTGYNQYENTVSASNVRNLDLAWAVPIGGVVYGSPVVGNGKVYLRNSQTRKLHAYDARTGAPVAGFPVAVGPGVEAGAAPALYGNIVYVTGNDSAGIPYLRAFNATSGTAITALTKKLAGIAVGAPLVVGSNIYQADYYGRIFGFNAATGAQLANYPITISDRLSTTPVIVKGVMYNQGQTGKIYAHNVVTGALLPPLPSPATDQITGLTTANNQIISANNIGSNGAIFTTRIEGPPSSTSYYYPGKNYGTPAIANGKVVFVISAPSVTGGFSSATLNCLALDAYDFGAMQWQDQNPFPIFSIPIIANGVVYVNSERYIHAHDLQTGEELWAYYSPMPVESAGASPVFVNGMLYTIANIAGRPELRAFSLNGDQMPLGAQAKPALAKLKPDFSLKAQ